MDNKKEPCVKIGLREIYDELQLIKAGIEISKNNERHIKHLYKAVSVGGSVLGFVILLMINHLA